jgi:uncharacterized membrane protein YfhO
MFNGFSFPERRWVYILALSSSALCGLFIQHLSTLNMKYYLIRTIPVSIIALLYVLQRLSGNEKPLKALSKYCDNEPINNIHVTIAKSL